MVNINGKNTGKKMTWKKKFSLISPEANAKEKDQLKKEKKIIYA